MRYRVTHNNWLYTLFILLVLLLAYLFVSWMDESVRLAATQARLSEREHEILAMLDGRTIRLGDGLYMQCTTGELIPSIVEGNI